MSLFRFFFLLLLDEVNIECLKDREGRAYGGHMNITGSGKPCQMWSKQSPHKHAYVGMGDMNFCRTTVSSMKPWCYTNDPAVEFEYCDIPFCDLGEFYNYGVIRMIMAGDA